MAEIMRYVHRTALLGWIALAATTAMSTVFAASAVFGNITVPAPDNGTLAELPNMQPLTAEAISSEIQAILDKPLFLPGRAPLKPAAAIATPVAFQPAQEEPPPPDYSIGGIVITPVRRQVLLRTQPGEVGSWLAEGEFTSEGWSLASVTPTQVLFARSGRQVVVKLYNTQP